MFSNQAVTTLHGEREGSPELPHHQDEENVPPNSAARRKKNPFKSHERMAFPPLDEALAFGRENRTKGCNIREIDKMEGSPGPVTLTISMQALLHPDSFHSTSFSSSVEADDGEESVGAEWEVGCLEDLVSPERDPDIPACLLTEEGWDEQNDDESDSDAEPCMADLFEAMQFANKQLSPVHSQNGSMSESQEQEVTFSQGLDDASLESDAGPMERSWVDAPNMSDVGCCPATPNCKLGSASGNETPGVHAASGAFDTARTPTTPASVLRVSSKSVVVGHESVKRCKREAFSLQAVRQK
jgi:hypothetical protein